MREDVQPSGLVSHHTAHDLVEGFYFPRMGIVVLKPISFPTLRVLEFAARGASITTLLMFEGVAYCICVLAFELPNHTLLYLSLS